ncbi:PLP-dependent aminotransferase family protein [Microbacterium azadirachtae]|uniref:Putative HTH-type transcriptional regulator YjiR n=1 Tax=Microbacterium azadirachtae TaxID=582680 RepID=A0A0F0LBY8_9MICO|nr:PLP-dependent aminotransferase family protein [Microbacterium azadirachtae]KJL30702.1 putative HTH-type transcriptional regulator YjiR [Microbacterium azadirachtae]
MTAAYKSIVDRFATSIRDGRVPAGTRLPTHRALAREHRIALATASRVYAELAAMGLVAGEPGRGTFVRDQRGHDGVEPSRRLPVPRIADLSFNQPLAAEQTSQLRHALRELSTSGNLEAVLHQQPPGGRSRERAIVATHLLDRGIDVPPARVLLANGAQQALDAVLTATTRPGDVIAVDALTYPGFALLAAAHSLEIAPIPSGAAGPDLQALDRLCAARPVRAIYTIPTVHNPLGWTLDRPTRERLVAIARARDAWIIEDGTYAFLDEAPPLPVQALAPERTFYVASLSKNVATGLRFGFLVAPGAHEQQIVRSLRTSTWGVSGLITALATGWIADGTVARLEKTRRDDATERQQIARAAFRQLDYTAHPSSYFGWLRLPPDLRADQAASHLADVGILVTTADAFASTDHAPHALRLALATPAIDQLADVLERVSRTVDSMPR